MLNRVILIGRLVRDPEVGYLEQSGIARARMRIAVDRSRRNPETNERETDFIDLVAWRNQAEFASQYLQKGRLVAVEGRLQMRSWEAQDGTRRVAAEVIVDSIQALDRPKEAAEGHAAETPELHEGGSQEDRRSVARGTATETMTVSEEEEDPFGDI